MATQIKSDTQCAKIWMLINSFIFAVTAVLLTIIGTTIGKMFYDFEYLIYNHFFIPAALLIAIGVILLFVATLGAYGVIKESCMLINLYGVFLLLTSILEISTSIGAFVMRSEIREILKVGMNEAMADYNMSENIKNAVDAMQKSLECCGCDSPSDWSKYMRKTVPESCCGVVIMEDEMYGECQNQYQYGCYEKISDIIIIIAFCAVAMAFIQLSGAFHAFSSAKTLRRHKSLREAHIWQLQQNLDVSVHRGIMNTTERSPITGYAQLESTPITYTTNSPSIIS